MAHGNIVWEYYLAETGSCYHIDRTHFFSPIAFNIWSEYCLKSQAVSTMSSSYSNRHGLQKSCQESTVL